MNTEIKAGVYRLGGKNSDSLVVVDSSGWVINGGWELREVAPGIGAAFDYDGRKRSGDLPFERVCDTPEGFAQGDYNGIINHARKAML